MHIKLINSIHLSPLETTNPSATQEFTNILWNTKDDYRVHKIPPYLEPEESSQYHPSLFLQDPS
jgi:hypothetical protein